MSNMNLNSQNYKKKLIFKYQNYRRQLKFKYQDHPITSSETIKLFWWKERHNFGDALNTELINRLSSRRCEWVPNNYSQEFYMAIGSVIGLASDNTIIWGSGFMDAGWEPYRKPRNILAVRGPLTRKRLVDLKIHCPKIYGDPALIMPELYYPNCERHFDLGIIPHWSNKKDKFFDQNFNDNIKIIDIEQTSCEDFIRDVMSCKRIISSSLHGIIIADAYEIPALRVHFSKVLWGGDFKFNDYYISIEREITPTYSVTESTTIADLLKLNFNYTKKIDIQKLMSVNPFN